MNETDATFRANVGAVIADDADRVLMFERADVRGAWQFPQGGMRHGEEPIDAVRRELLEETGIDATDLHLLEVHPEWLAYELPPADRSEKTGHGQVQKWFLFRLSGNVDVTLPTGPDAEFVDHRWVANDEPERIVVEFKRPTYRILTSWIRQQLRDARSKLTSAGHEYVLAELDHVTTSLLSNEEMGERRVSNLVTLIALLATAVGLAIQNLPETTDLSGRWIAFFAAVAALVVGVLTFLRILKRNIHTTELQIKAARLRFALTRHDPVAAAVMPFGVPMPRQFGWLRAGLAEIVAVLNALLTASAVALLASPDGDPSTVRIVAAIASFLVAAEFQRWWASRRYASSPSSGESSADSER